MGKNPFTRHPREMGESYGQHFVAAVGFGLKMIGGGLACLVHAFFPFLFETTGSDTVRKLNRKLGGRVEKANWERHPII